MRQVRQTFAILRAIARDGRWRRSLALAVVFAIGCGLLSWWQFARREETARANALVEANYGASPRPLDQVLPGPSSFDAARQEWLPVELRGTYLTDRQLLVRDRQLGPNPGFEVITPLRLTDGRIFVVDRGFLSVGTKQDRPDAIPAPPTGTVTVVARLQADEGAIPGRTAEAGQIPSIDLSAVARALRAPTYTAAYGLMRSETPAAAVNPAPLQPPSFADAEGTHLSYAIQWILFALLAFGVLGWSVRRELLEAGDPDVGGGDEQRSARRRARSDESVEDALIDR